MTAEPTKPKSKKTKAEERSQKAEKRRHRAIASTLVKDARDGLRSRKGVSRRAEAEAENSKCKKVASAAERERLINEAAKELTPEAFAATHDAQVENTYDEAKGVWFGRKVSGKTKREIETVRRRTTYMDKLRASGGLASEGDDHLEATRYLAADRLAMDYEIGLEPRIKVAKLSDAPGGGGDADEAAMQRRAAARRYNNAIASIPLNARASTIKAVVAGEPPYENDDNRVQKAVKTDQVRTGCDALIDHYRITRQDVV